MTEEIKEEQAQLASEEDSIKHVIVSASDQIRHRSKDFFSTYANSVAIGTNMWDISVTFGEIDGAEGGKAVIQERFRVSMTREVAKAFAYVLTSKVAESEKEYGKIKVPKVSKVEAVAPTEAPAEANTKAEPKGGVEADSTPNQ